ncbi:MAG: GumC family protein [Desulfomonilaceae bacterium]
MEFVERGGPTSPEPSSHPSNEGTSLSYYVEAIYIRKRLFLCILLGIPCIVLIISLLMTKVYQASTRIWAKEQQTGNPFQREEAQPTFLKDQQLLILSDAVTTRVLEALPPQIATGAAQKTWSDLPFAQRAKSIADLQQNVDVKVDLKEGVSNFIEIRVKAGTPEEAAHLANLFAGKYIDYYFEVRSEIAHSSYKFLETQRDELAEQLKESEKKLQDFEISLGPNLIQLIELNKESSSSAFSGSFKIIEEYELLAADWAERSRAEALVQELRKEDRGMFVPLDSNSKNLSQVHLQDKLIDLRAKLTDLKQRWIGAPPQIEMLQNEIASAEDLLFQNRNVESQAIKEKLDFMQERAKKIEQDFKDIAVNRVTYQNLRRDAANRAAMFKKVEEELESSRMAAEMSIRKTTSIVVIDRAMPPLAPIKPRMIVNLVIGLLLGVGMSLWVVLFLASLDQTIRRPEQVKSRLGIDLLGSISLFRKKE